MSQFNPFEEEHQQQPKSTGRNWGAVDQYRGQRDQFLERPLPSNTEGERAILGAVLLDNSLINQALDLINEDDFYSPFHRAVYKGMLAVFERGGKLDPIIIGEELKKEGKLESYGGVTAIANLTYGLPHFNGVEAYCKLVREKSYGRQLIKACNTIVSETLAEEDDSYVTIDRAEELILALSNAARKNETVRERGFKSLKELKPAFLEQIEAYHRGDVVAMSSGMSKLDETLDGGGFQKNGIYFVLAPPKTGKTALTLGWARHIADFHDRLILGVSAEMNQIQYLQRLYSAHIGIPYWMFRPGFHGKEYDIAKARMDEFVKLPMKITDSMFTVADLWKYVGREVKGAKGTIESPEVGALFVDYLQIISLTGKVDLKEMYKEVDAVSRELKRMASYFGIPIIAISSMNRDGAAENPIPELHNVRGSGVPAYDAEAVFALHNPAFVPGKSYKRPPVADINLHILAQRNGPTDVLPLKFIGEYMQFLQASDFDRINGRETEAIVTPAQYEEEMDSSELWDLGTGKG